MQKAGMPVGVCPEQWILENPDIMIKLQEDYVAAGTDILYAPTFTANRIKLEEYGLADRLEEMNRELIALSQKAAQGKALVASDMTMTGQQLYPIGDLMFEDLVDVYKEQAEVVADAGADLFVVETMMSLQECRAAVIAIREVCDLPIMVSLTYNPDGRTLYGTDPATATVVLQSLGADAIGINCSTGSEDMIEPVEKNGRVCHNPNPCKAECRAAGAGEWCDSLQDGIRGVCFLWKKTGGGRCVHYRRSLWHDTGAYPCTERSSEGYASA